MTPAELTRAVRAAARDVGFDRIGVVDEGTSRHMDRLRAWIRAGHHGEMGYLSRPDSLHRRADLRGTLEDFRSAVVVAHEYGDEAPARNGLHPSRAVVARYARGRDYHHIMGERLVQLADRIAPLRGSGVNTVWYVDTGPLLERELGSRAGLGWFGKNTMLIHPRHGSYFFLGVLLTNLAMEPSAPFEDEHCGTCRRCLDACPTGALLGRDAGGAPVMDARRCISYLTIELRGPIPVELREPMGNRVFGCDICQEVCPFNGRFSTATEEPAYRPVAGLDGPSLVELAERLLGLSEKAFGRAFADSPLLRAKRKGLLRNLCVALGNWRSEEAVPTLLRALSDSAALVRGHAAWALGRGGSTQGRRGLVEQLRAEEDAWVRAEIQASLDRLNPS